MLSFFRRRKAHSFSSRRMIPQSFFEPLESRQLLAADVTVGLQMTTPNNVLLPGEQPRDLVYDAGRHQLLAVLHDRIRRYDSATGESLGSIKVGSDLHSADITADGKYLYVTEQHNPAVYKIDLDAGTYTSIVVSADATAGTPGDVAMGLSGAIVGEYPESPNTLFRSREINLADDAVSDVLLSGGTFSLNDYAVLARSADYGYVAMVSAHDNYQFVNDTLSGYGGQNYGGIYGLAVSRDGSMIAVGKYGNIDVIGSEGSLLRNVGVSKAGLVFSPTSDVIYVADTGWDLLTAFRTSDWTALFSVAVGESIPDANPYGSGVMAVSDDGNMLYMATPSGVRMFDLSFSSAFYGNSVSFQANLSSSVGGISGQVTFLDANSGATLGQGSIVSGHANLTLSTLHAGDYSIVAHYEGDANHNPGDSAGKSLTIKRGVTSGVLSAVGANAVKLTVSAPAGSVLGGNGSFFDGGNLLGTVALSSGAANWSNLPVGVHSITAAYDGTSDFLPVISDAAQIIVQAATNTLFNASSQSTSYGQALTLTATVSPGVDAAGGTVNFSEGPFSWGSAIVDASGQAVLNLSNLSVGSHLITAQFSGNTFTLGSASGQLAFDVAKAATTIAAIASPSQVIYGSSTTITATVSSAVAVNEGNVVFTNGATVLGSAAVVNGQAQGSFSLWSNTTITATYAGSGNFDASAGSNASVTVAKAATTTGLIRSATWIPKGQYVEWRATVSGVGTSEGPVGSVAFKEGTKVLKTVALGNGQAVFRSKSLLVGDHTITASFLGGSFFKTSTAKGVKTTVVNATTIDLMVMYTPLAQLDMGGVSQMATRIKDSVWGTNTALWNSRIPVVVRLVHTGEVNYVETGSLETDLTRLAGTRDGYMDSVHTLRNQYKADLVSLFEYDGDAGGLGYELQDVDNSHNNEYGFSVLLAFQAAGPSYTLAHELGHNLGASHDKANAGGPGATSYSYGWRFIADGTEYHDIMAYPPGTTIPYFSNPRVKYKGVPTGSATADSARTITFTAPYVAKYR